MTVAASPLQQKVTDQGDVIVKPNQVFTIRAVGTRPDDGFFLR